MLLRYLIVLSYNCACIEELLIDFHEIIGEHSRANLAEAVWNTLELYGLKNQVMAIVCDNVSNNDTLLQALREKCANEGIDFSAKHSCIHCLPHIVHLAAMQLLEGIGAIKPDAK
ncbi:hypothetical protein DFH29DRAFT_812742 [Suillus ampliporus]|nr:hypothetical protein DFH29DRAFT_812742 [Suillus ampliporus]